VSQPPPFFSVITPSFNQGQWIEGCIKSVLAQGITDFEHIVFDNCSTDSTAEVAARYPHLQWHSERDRGQSDALNKALALARGEVICWLNADDQYLPGTFETIRHAMSDPAVSVVFGDAEEIYFDGRSSGIRRARFERREDFLVWWEKRTDLLQPAIFFRRSAIQEAGPLREDLHLIMDTELWWRLSEKHRFHYLGKPLAVQQRQPDSKTIRHAARIYEEKARVFGPLLDAAYPQDCAKNRLARRRGMGWRYLGLAQSAAREDRQTARTFFRLALRENPLLVLSPKWWKAFVWTMRAPSSEVSRGAAEFAEEKKEIGHETHGRGNA